MPNIQARSALFTAALTLMSTLSGAHAQTSTAFGGIAVPVAWLSTDSKSVTALDLDLTSVAGQQELMHRVHQAAFQVCTRVAGGGALGDDDITQCEKEALAGAMPRMQAMIAAANDKTRYAVAARSQP